MLVVARPHLAMHEAAEPLGDVANPAGLAVFAVADDVHADVRLLANDAGDFLPQGLFIRGLVVWLPMVARRQDVADRHRAHEAADMRDKNTVGAAFHRILPVGMWVGPAPAPVAATASSASLRTARASTSRWISDVPS